MYKYTYKKAHLQIFMHLRSKYVCMYVCMYVCVYVCMYVCMCVCMCVCMYVCMYVCICMCVCICIYIHVCVYVCMHACMHACIIRMYLCENIYNRSCVKKSAHYFCVSHYIFDVYIYVFILTLA